MVYRDELLVILVSAPCDPVELDTQSTGML